jgi:hypothetical protein
MRNSFLRFALLNKYYNKISHKTKQYLVNTNEKIKKNKEQFITNYYDAMINYYSLSDEEIAILDFVTSILY